MTRHIWTSAAAVVSVAVSLLVATRVLAAQTTIFSENFDAMTLGTNNWEPNATGPISGLTGEQNAFTHDPPTGWTNDRSLLAFSINDPDNGVPEWEGWSFTKKDWWAGVAGGQRRTEFAKAMGTVAVVDPDEWDDLGDPEGLGLYEAYLLTPSLSMTGATAGSALLQFDSSWRPEGFQTAVIEVSYDGGAFYSEIMRWESDESSAYYKDDNSTNDTIQVAMNNPDGATSAIVKFGMRDAGNNWWWAIDNVTVTHSGGAVLNEDFESVDLGPAEWEPSGHAGEVVTIENGYTLTPPDGWNVDNSQLPSGGVPEWQGWSFANPELWVASEDQRRSEFTKGQTVIAVADSDEWDDFTHEEGTFNTFLSTPEISLANVEADSVSLTFDSAWRDEDDQTVTIKVSYDSGEAVEVLRWESNPWLDEAETLPNPNFHDDNLDETVAIALHNPEGATSMVLEFGYFNASNNWFWAIDNLAITGDASHIMGDANGDNIVDDEDASILGAHWLQTSGVGWGEGDFNLDGVVNDKDAAILAAHWGDSVPENSVPEPSTGVLMFFALAALAVRRRAG